MADPKQPDLEWNDHDVIRGEIGDFRYRTQVVALPDGNYRWGASAGLPLKQHAAEGVTSDHHQAKRRSEAALQLLVSLVHLERHGAPVGFLTLRWEDR